MITLSKQQIEEWYRLLQGEAVCASLKVQPPRDEHRELIRLNHLVMEASHQIHNHEMLKDR